MTQENNVCMFIHCSHEQLQQAAGPSCFHIAPLILAFVSTPSAMSGKGKVEATGSVGPASSAQADTASAGSVQAGSAQIIRDSGGVFSCRFAPDVEYTTGNTTTVDSRGASIEPRPMPEFDVNIDNVQHVNIR